MATMTEQKEAAGMQAMMAAYEKLGTPGAQHQMLEGLAGRWDAQVKMWPGPGAAPVESAASSSGSMILGGRFLREEFHGDMMGKPFTGLGFTGYDNHAKRFESIWLDSTNTSILVFAGTASADGRTLTLECSHEDAVRGPTKWRSVTTVVDKDHHLFEMYATRDGGKEEKSLEIAYSRAK